MTRGRTIGIVVVVVVVVLLIAGVLAVRQLLAPERFTAMLRDQAAAVGLRLQVAEPARPAIWPHLAVRLQGLELRRVGYDEPMLRAREVRLVVPWDSLLKGRARIDKLRIRSPRIDVGQVKQWLGRFQARTSSGAPRLPAIDAGVLVTGGTLVEDNQLVLKSVRLETGMLRAGQPFVLNLDAIDPREHKLRLRLHTTPQQPDNAVTLDPLHLFLAAGEPPSLRLSGQLVWHGGLRVVGELHGKLKLAKGKYQTRIAWPAAASSSPATASSSLVAASSIQARPTSAAMQVSLQGDKGSLDLSLQPPQVLAWWQRVSAADNIRLSLPPLQGEARAARVDVGSFEIRGLSVRTSLPAAPTSSNGPATAASSP